MQEALKQFAAATNNELFDPEYKGGEWMVAAVETHETLADWAQSSQGWLSASTMRTGEIAGFAFRSWTTAQPRKGMPRGSISVIDFGDRRVVLVGTDLNCFA